MRRSQIAKCAAAMLTAAALVLAPAAGMQASAAIRLPAVCVFASAVTVETEEELIAALSDCSTDAENPTEIVLSSSIESESELTVEEGTYVVLRGADEDCVLQVTGTHSSAQSDDTEAFLTVNGELTIESLTVDADSIMRVAIVNANACLTLEDGAVITGGRIGKKAQMHGAGIFVKGKLYNPATLIINDGASVTGNEAGGESGSDFATYGAGVAAQSQADIIMNGGSISGNTDVSTGNLNQSCRGGGIWLGTSRSTLTLNGGEITGNYARSGGGGIYMAAGVFTMNGGTIAENSTIYNGGGLYAVGTAQINGGSIENNTVETPSESDINALANLGVLDSSGIGTGGGIYVGVTSDITDTTVTMTGGSITGNQTLCTLTTTSNDINYGQGGGVFNDSTFVMTGGSITGNTASSVNEGTEYNYTGVGGGIATEAGDEDEYGTTILQGGEISGNTAENGGDDLFTNAYKYETDRSNVTTYYDTPGVVQISGAVSIGEALLPDSLYFYVTGSLDGASIGVTGEDVLSDVIVAAGEDYTLTETDAAAFTALTDGYKVSLYEDYNTLVYDETREYISLRDALIEAIPDQIYTGAAVTPSVTVTLDGVTLTEGEDYTLSYADNVETGTATVTARGIGSYGQTVTQTFAITLDPDLANYTLQLSAEEFVYTGYEQTPEVSVVYTQDESVVLAQEDNYTITYARSSRAAGTYSVTVTGTGSFDGTLSADYTIVPADLEDVTAELSAQTYTGSAIEYAPAYGEILYGDYSLLRGADEDYTIVSGSYTNNIAVGTASFQITGAANFTGTMTLTFAITEAETSESVEQTTDTAVNLSAVTANLSAQTFTGKKIKYVPAYGEITYGSYKLVCGKDYTIVSGSYKNNKKAGTASFQIKGCGSFTGTKTVTFKIKKVSVKKAKAKTGKAKYTGKKIKYNPKKGTITYGSYTLKKGRDYTIVKGSYKNNKNTGTASLKIKGKGSFKGTKTVKFKIVR